MKTNITIEEIRALTEGQRVALKSIWIPSNGDAMTDGEHTYMYYNEQALPLENGNEAAFDSATFLPLLTLSQVYDLMEEHFYLTDLNFLLPEDVYELVWQEDQTTLVQECLDGLWRLFTSNLTYQSLILKLGALLVETFAPYAQGEEYDSVLEDGIFIEQELFDKKPEMYQQIIDNMDEISPFIYRDVERLFEESWDIFHEKFAV